MGKRSLFNWKKGKDNFLTPISVVGVLVPKSSGDDQCREFALATLSGVQYSILSDSDWEQVLQSYRWEEVRVRGLLNSSTMTIVPQWIVPHGPTGEPQSVTDKPLWINRGIVGKIKKSVADLVLAPAYA
jgi:hypothetical protein